jgi:zinc protease
MAIGPALALSGLLANPLDLGRLLDPGRSRPPMPFHEATLDNGLRVVILPDHDTPLVALHLQLNVGGADDPDDRPGVAHLFEHLMFGGSAHAPAGAFDRLLAAAGGDNNAWTDLDHTAYHLVVPRGALDLALFLESDRLGFLAGGLTTDELENQRKVVAGEYGIADDEPHGMDAEALAFAFYPEGHPYRRGVLGQMGRLAAASREELLAFHAAWYRPDNLTLALVGDVDPEAALARVAHWFGDIPRPTAPMPTRRSAPAVRIEGEQRRVYVDEIDDASLVIAWPTVPAGHPDEAPLDLLSSLLSSGPGSRLDDALYYDQRRVDSLSAWTENGRLGGRFHIELSQQEGPLGPSLRHLDAALDAVRRSPPTAAEVRRIQVRWAGGFLRQGTGLEERAELINRCLWLRGDPDCQGWHEARYAALTAQDIARVLDTYLHPKNRLLLSVVSPEERDFALAGSTAVEVW